MKVPKSRKKFVTIMMCMAVAIVIWEILWIVCSVLYGSFIPALAGTVTAILFAVILAEFYYSGARFVCPECNCGFVPPRADFMKSIHVKRGRKFTCPTCGKEVVAIESFKWDVEGETADQE